MKSTTQRPVYIYIIGQHTSCSWDKISVAIHSPAPLYPEEQPPIVENIRDHHFEVLPLVHRVDPLETDIVGNQRQQRDRDVLLNPV